MSTHLINRLHYLQQSFSEHQLHGLLITSPANLIYLTGVYPFSSDHEAFLLITTTKAQLFVSPLRLAEFSHLKHLGPTPLSKDRPLSASINQIVKSSQTLGIEADNLHVSEFNSLQSKIKTKLKPTTDIVLELRLIKDQQEVKHITKACLITARAWDWLLPQIKPGVSEKQLSRLLINHLYDLGADAIPEGFDPIVASGPNSSVPHHTTSNRIIRVGEPVLVDFGCSVCGYASDFTRTTFIGKPSPQFLQIESIVQSAYQRGLKAISQLTAPQQVDQVVRDVITQAGFGDNFIHNTGHGLGLEIHEPPHFHHQYQEANHLKPNMVIAIEPGIYLPGKFGYRYENTILITKTKPKILTQS